MEKSTVRLKTTRPGWYSTTPLSSARNSYNNENRVHSSRVMGLPDAAENSPRVASDKQHGVASDNTQNLPIIGVSEFYFWQTITPESNVREAPTLERTIRGIHTIDGGSRPLYHTHTCSLPPSLTVHCITHTCPFPLSLTVSHTHMPSPPITHSLDSPCSEVVPPQWETLGSSLSAAPDPALSSPPSLAASRSSVWSCGTPRSLPTRGSCVGQTPGRCLWRYDHPAGWCESGGAYTALAWNSCWAGVFNG